MGDAGGKLGEGNADGAVDAQGKALEALRKGAQKLAEAMQQGDGDGQGPGDRAGRQQAGANGTDPLGRPLRSHEYRRAVEDDPGRDRRAEGAPASSKSCAGASPIRPARRSSSTTSSGS